MNRVDRYAQMNRDELAEECRRLDNIVRRNTMTLEMPQDFAKDYQPKFEEDWRAIVSVVNEQRVGIAECFMIGNEMLVQSLLKMASKEQQVKYADMVRYEMTVHINQLMRELKVQGSTQ